MTAEAGEAKQIEWDVVLGGLDERMAAEGAVVAEDENPDDAAVENNGIGVAVT